MSVYFIQVAGSIGPVKIGFAWDVPARLKTLQTGHHEELVLIREIPDAGDLEERALHFHFWDRRIRGEWFHFHPDMLTIFPGREAPRLPSQSAELRARRKGIMQACWDKARAGDPRYKTLAAKLKKPVHAMNSATPSAHLSPLGKYSDEATA